MAALSRVVGRCCMPVLLDGHVGVCQSFFLRLIFLFLSPSVPSLSYKLCVEAGLFIEEEQWCMLKNHLVVNSNSPKCT